MKCNGHYDEYPDRCDECPRYMDDCDGAQYIYVQDEEVSDENSES